MDRRKKKRKAHARQTRALRTLKVRKPRGGKGYKASPLNRARAERVEAAMLMSERLSGDGLTVTDKEGIVRRFLKDLMHYCTQHGADFKQALALASIEFQGERK